MLLLGVVTNASSQPVGSNSLAKVLPEYDVEAESSHYAHQQKTTKKSISFGKEISNTKMCIIKQYRSNRKYAVPDGTMAKAKALLSSMAEASGAVSVNPCGQKIISHKYNRNLMLHISQSFVVNGSGKFVTSIIGIKIFI